MKLIVTKLEKRKFNDIFAKFVSIK